MFVAIMAVDQTPDNNGDDAWSRDATTRRTYRKRTDNLRMKVLDMVMRPQVCLEGLELTGL